MSIRYPPIVLLAWLCGVCAAGAAPPQLLNKTVIISFSLQQVMREADGKTFGVSVAVHYIDYIGNAGRIFERSSRTIGNQSQGGDKDPDATHNKIGEARDAHFEGNKLVIINSFISGAIRIVVSFDPSFSSCSAEVLMAREGNRPMKRPGVDGVVREILSSTPSGSSRSIRDGNAFAS